MINMIETYINGIYETIYDIESFPYKKVSELMKNNIVKKYSGKGKRYGVRLEYINIPCAFDIETTTLTEKVVDKDKIRTVGVDAIVYQWQFDVFINEKHYPVFGNTLEEYTTFINRLAYFCGCNKFGGENKKPRKMVVFVHNLSYEYQFIRDYFKTEKMFATDKRKVLTYTTTNMVEYRCSYKLSGMNLKKFCENSRNVIHGKMNGDLDYNKFRTPLNKNLSLQEIGYCLNDVCGLTECIADRLKDFTMASIPLTATGYVRREYQIACQISGYHAYMQKTAINEEVFTLAREEFRGGDTGANPLYIGKEMHNLIGFDIQSSYPAQMCISDEYPIGKWEKSEFSVENIRKKACLFRCKMTGVERKMNTYLGYLDFGHCRNTKNAVVSNGRIVRCDEMEVTFGNIDFQIFIEEYDIETIEIFDFWICEKGMLPLPIRQKLIEFYTKKTQLKNVKGSEYEYARAKENTNASYGMSVQNPLHNDITDDITLKEWTTVENNNITEMLDKYYSKVENFQHYTWGCWTTQLARKQLRDAIHECGVDFVYSDTDSIKFINPKKHEKYFNDFNKKQIAKCGKVEPQATAFKGSKEYPLGIWDKEFKNIRKFKTFGAKKYALIEGSGDIEVTVAGCSKKCAEYLKKLNSKNPMSEFKIGLVVPPEYSGRTTSWFIDRYKTTHITINNEKIPAASGIAVVPTSYTLGVSDTFEQVLKTEWNVDVTVSDETS